MFLTTPSPEERYHSLVLPHVPLLYRLALRYAGNEYDAEDLGYGLVRCSRCPWGETRVSHLYYRKGDRLLSLFILPSAYEGADSRPGVFEVEGLKVRVVAGMGGASPAAIVSTESLELST